MIKFVMVDGSAIKSDDKYNLGQFKDLIGKKYSFDKDDIVTVFRLSNLPLFAQIDDISGKKVFINMNNVLYIEECNK